MNNNWQEFFGGIFVGLCLILVGMFIQWQFFTEEQIIPCWSSFTDVYMETWHQEELDNPWDLDNPNLSNDFCVQDEEKPYLWRWPTKDERYQEWKDSR